MEEQLALGYTRCVMLETPFEQGSLTQSMLFDHFTENNILSVSPDSSAMS